MKPLCYNLRQHRAKTKYRPHLPNNESSIPPPSQRNWRECYPSLYYTLKRGCSNQFMLLLLCCRLARHIMRLTAMSGRGTQTIPQDQLQDTDELQEWNKTIANSLENVLGKFYKPKTRHRFLPPLPKLKFNQNQMIVYSSLQFKDLQAIVEPKTPAVLLNNATRYKSSSSLLPRIPKIGGYKTSSDSKNTTYYNTSVKQNRANNLVSQKTTSRKPHEGAMPRSSFKK